MLRIILIARFESFEPLESEPSPAEA